MSVRSGQSITVLFTTRAFATGMGTNADSLPTGTLFLNGTANGASVTVTNVSTGLYKAAVTLPTLAVGDEVEIIVAATVSSISDTAVIWGDTKDFFAGAIPDVVAGGSGGLFIAGSNAATTISGLTTGALACTTLTASGAVAFQSTFATTGTTTFNAFTVTNATTLTGAVSLGSTLTVTGNCSFGGTYSVAGAVALQSSLAVTGATTLTGAVTASNASNNITGITVAALANNVITASSVASGALNGKGDWLVSSSYPTNFSALGITAGGKISEVVLVDTLTTYTGNTVQTGDSFARIGATGSGLTSLAPSATALSTAQWTNSLATNLGTLAGHDPGATLASTTNITAGTITTATNLTNAAMAGDFTSVMKTSLNAATPTSIQNVTNIVSAGAITTSSGAVSNVATTGTVTNPVTIALTAAVPTSNTANTIGDCLNAARVQGEGKWILNSDTLTLYAPDNSTVVRSFIVGYDSNGNATSRT